MQPQPIITSVNNTWIKSLKKLHSTSHRNEQKRFLIEGQHLLEEAIATRWPLDAICFSPNWGKSNHDLLSDFAKHALYKQALLQTVSDEILQRLSTTHSSCPVIAIAHSPESNLRTSNMLTLAIAAESLQDPGNVGALIRITAAVGMSPVILSSDSVDPTNPKVLRATAGQWFRNPPITTDLIPFLHTQRKGQVQILAASSDGPSYWECDLTVPTIFLLGNEGAGLSVEIRAESTGSIAIPMASGVESLNVAITGALLTYEAQRQRLKTKD